MLFRPALIAAPVGLSVLLFSPAGPAPARADVRISQVCGAGGLNASCPSFDFVELHNTAATPADVSGWSLQLAPGSGAAWTVLPFPSGTVIQPHGYFLIQCERPLAVGVLPDALPDLVFAASPLFSSSGKVALLASQTTITGSDPRIGASGPFLRDFLGYGAASAAEGAPAPAPGAGPPCRVLVRVCAGELDTNSNLADFELVPYDPALPRSSGSPPPVATPEITSVTVTPAAAPAGQTFLLTARIAPCVSGAVTVTADASPVGGPFQVALRDDGQDGDQTAGDRVFSARLTAGAAPPALYDLVVTSRDASGRTDAKAVGFALLPPLKPLRVSQVFAGGGTSAEAFNSDYVEIHNASDETVDLAGYGVLFASPVSPVWDRVSLSGQIEPRGYYLIQLNDPPFLQGRPLPLADAFAGISPFIPGGGKVAIVASPMTPSAACPTPADRIVDLVGGGTSDCREGGGPADNAPWGGFTPSAILRRCDGGIDSGVNAADWTLAPAAPRTTASAPAPGLLLENLTLTPGAPVLPGASMTLTARFARCDGPAPAGATLTVDLAAVGGPAQAPLLDSGASADGAAGDGIFGLIFTVSPLTPPGDQTITLTGRSSDGGVITAPARISVLQPALGSCCDHTACVITSEAQCQAQGGRWLGAGTACRALSERATATVYNGIPVLPNVLPDLSNERFPFTIRNSGVVIGPRGLRVRLGLQHSWAGDLTVTLSNGVTTCVLLNRPLRTGPGEPGAPANLEGEYTFADTADGDLWTAAQGLSTSQTLPPGEYRPAAALTGGLPAESLTNFAGQPLDGSWLLTVVDGGAGDSGYLISLSLVDNRVRSSCCPGDFNIDGFLDPDDLADLIACFFQPQPCSEADINEDGVINPDDLADGIGAYFTGCP